ncbi:protein ALTERED SEED GERMINATION 2-like isoform X2 [Aristolochia californica]|uniref:protein ALTERED SEED GERMINATION 2-like isoform X2 n=1 Tax=Aristolochia californica TaxID=171875 RepID=UPI0035DFE889
MFGSGIIAGKLHNDKSRGWISGSRFTTSTEIGHQGCVNAITWNSKGSLLVSGSDDTRVNLWSYTSKSLLHSIDSGHTANIFCTKFVPETSDDLVVSGAGDAEVRLFNLSYLHGQSTEEALEPMALFRCHSRRVKKLAVEVGNPNVVWSASEDGTLRQHDFREGSSCPPAGSSHQECHNILLDLRFGAKKSLADPPKHCLALKSCDISTTRPHQLLVGGSDAYARLYDRRMLLPLSSSEKRMKPPPCVNYFCPMHLSDRGRSTLHLTHVTFSPNGEEVLVSYSGEHVYLMDANLGSKGVLRYSVEDFAKQLHLAPTPGEVETVQDLMAKHFQCSNDGIQNCNNPMKLQQCQELLEAAEKCLERSDYLNGIEACNELLDGRIRHFGPALENSCLCTRSSLFLKRKWKNDVHMAIRDCSKARSKDPSSYRAYFCLAEALLELGKHKEALEHAMVAHHLAPSNFQVSEMVENIKQHLASEAAEKNNDGSIGESRKGKSRSLHDVNHQKEANSDALQDCPRSQREAGDIQEDMELDFETSILDDEGHDIESGILRGSLNLRFHCKPNGSCGSPSSSSQTENLTYQPEVVIDMKQRYVGHYNVGTDIKQASFLGQNGEYIASGSDDGRWFIWEKKTGRLVKMLAGDEAVVNCVQCHPFDCTIATSGIDDTIKIWTPQSEVPSIVAGGTAGPETADVLSAMEANQRKLLSREHVFSKNHQVDLRLDLS